MKKVIIGAAMAVVLTCAVVVWAADKTQATKEQTPQTTGAQPAPRGPAAQMRGRGPAGVPGPGGMQQAYEEFTKKREEEHKKAIAELEEIRKIAESEKATKTVAALQKMIDFKNAEFKKSAEETEKKRAEMQQRMEQRQKEMAAKNAQNPPVKPEDKPKEKTPVKKIDK
jgi:hypothetical protein